MPYVHHVFSIFFLPCEVWLELLYLPLVVPSSSAKVKGNLNEAVVPPTAHLDEPTLNICITLVDGSFGLFYENSIKMCVLHLDGNMDSEALVNEPLIISYNR